MSGMGGMGDILGHICKIALPIPEESYTGNPASPLAVCTLSSIGLLKQIAASDMLHAVFMVGRLFSENRGIDSLVRHVDSHRNIKTILVCGKEVRGHMAGHSLFQLHKNGTDHAGRIIGSASPAPVLTVSRREIAHFQGAVSLVDMVGTTDIRRIRERLNSLSSASPC